MRNRFFSQVINMMVIIQEVKVECNEDSEFDIEVVDHTVTVTFGDVFDSFTDEIAKRFYAEEFECHFEIVSKEIS